MLDRNLPKGWFLLYCPHCPTSITWTKEVHQTYGFEEWFEMISWAISQCNHDQNCPTEAS